MKETELAYIAGIIDGEGSVKIYKSHSRTYDVSVDICFHLWSLKPAKYKQSTAASKVLQEADRIRIKALQIKGQRLSKDAVQT